MSAGRFNLRAGRPRAVGDPVFDYPYLRRRAGGVLRTRASGRSALTVKQMTVITVWPGATAQEMQDQVAEPLENDSGAKVVRSHGDLYPPA